MDSVKNCWNAPQTKHTSKMDNVVSIRSIKMNQTSPESMTSSSKSSCRMKRTGLEFTLHQSDPTSCLTNGDWSENGLKQGKHETKLYLRNWSKASMQTEGKVDPNLTLA